MNGGPGDPAAIDVTGLPCDGKRLRILYHHRVRSRDGQTVHIDELVAALRSLGHTVEIVAPPGFAQDAFGAAPKHIGLLKAYLPASLYELLEILYNVPAFWRLGAAYWRLRPDIIYERCNLHLLAGTVLSALTGTPLLLEVNAPLAEERAQYGGLGMPRLAASLERVVWRRAAYVLPVTAVLAAGISTAGVPARRILVLPNGIDPERFLHRNDGAAAKRRYGLDGRLVLGFTGFMREWHGLDAIVDMLALPQTPPELHLLLVGDGPARPALEQQAARLGVSDRVTFAGIVDRDSVAAVIDAFDIALQPRAVPYASPLKLVEYMAAAKAIIAPDQPNIREVLEPDRTALLYDPSEAPAMIAGILRLAGDPALRQRLGDAAHHAILERGLTWRHNAERISEIARAMRIAKAPLRTKADR